MKVMWHLMWHLILGLGGRWSGSWSWRRSPRDGSEPELDLEGLADAVAKDCQHVLCDAASHKLSIAFLVVLHGPAKQALADQGSIRLRVVEGVDGVVPVMIVSQLRAVVVDGLEACLQIDQANPVPIIDWDGLNVQDGGPSSQAVYCAVLIESVVDFHCKIVSNSSIPGEKKINLVQPIAFTCMPDSLDSLGVGAQLALLTLAILYGGRLGMKVTLD